MRCKVLLVFLGVTAAVVGVVEASNVTDQCHVDSTNLGGSFYIKPRDAPVSLHVAYYCVWVYTCN